jgi:hypothetical protein
MRTKRRRKQCDDIVHVINEIAGEINSILNDRRKDMYFAGTVLLYSFIENILKCSYS